MERPPLDGMRHIALRVRDMRAAREFYEGILGLRVVWEPDPDNVYLSSGSDNLALHRVPGVEGPGRLDHLGFLVPTREAVDAWERYMRARGVEFAAAPRDHRDGSRSFYVRDPDGNVIQMLYEPNASRAG